VLPFCIERHALQTALHFHCFFPRLPVNQPTPAIVAQGSVRRLPRMALLLLCLAYILPGYIGREPWKNADIMAFGYMAELARGGFNSLQAWLNPLIMGQPPEVDALLPYWLGAWAIQAAPGWIAPDFAARIPFGLMLALTLVATWYGVYNLARSPGAQPVAFAFGGEALPADYARAMADGGLLALIATLGLAQFSHETTPALAQLCFVSFIYFGLAAMPSRGALPFLAFATGLMGLTLSGGPSMALILGTGGTILFWLDTPRPDEPDPHRGWWTTGLLLAALAAAGLAWLLDLWQWRIAPPQANWREWRNIGRLFLWFTWPAWPLAIWTLWRWRRQLGQLRRHRHLALPLWFVLVATGTTLLTRASDRSLLLALPALATLAAFALPTLERSVSALIDWFTLLFFTSCAIIIWVIWVSMQTGIPRQPAANVAKLAPGFEPSFSAIAFVVALAATIAWVWLVKWRVGRHRAAIWKSLVLPAGGATLCWLLLTTLWLPLLDYARSYAPLVQRVATVTGPADCLQIHGLNRAQIAAFKFHGKATLRPAERQARCPWLIVDANDRATLPQAVDTEQWDLKATVRRPTDRNESILVYRRVGQTRP
jgi:4-amino-4-deoxy-L-arabinose transferase-like glycosyltransferase